MFISKDLNIVYEVISEEMMWLADRTACYGCYRADAKSLMRDCVCACVRPRGGGGWRDDGESYNSSMDYVGAVKRL